MNGAPSLAVGILLILLALAILTYATRGRGDRAMRDADLRRLMRPYRGSERDR